MEMKNRYVDNSGSPIPLETFPLNDNAEPYTPPQRTILWPELLVASAISMAMLLNGFTVGYSSCAIPRLLDSIKTADENYEAISWVATSASLAASVGGFLGGPLITYIGRRYTLIGTGVPFFISWILVASTSNLHLIIAGRVLSGICVGVVYSAFPVYIVETVQPKLRGALGLLPIAFRSGGIILVYLACPYLDISTMAYIAAALSVPIFLLFFVTPESPRWYIAKGHDHDARKALQWLRGKNYNIENEMQDLTQFQTEADKTKGIALKQMFYMENTPAILISFGLMIFQQLTGTTVIYYYAHRMFPNPIDIQSFYVRIVIVIVFSFVIAIILVDVIGRKMLLYISSASIILSTSTLGVFAYIQELNDNISFGSLSQLCLALYIFGSSVGYESISWLMLGEILPLKIRGTVVSVITGITWVCSTYMGTSFVRMIISGDPYSPLFLFAVIHLVAIIFVVCCVPETCGKTLEEIEINLTERVKSVNNRNGADRNTDANL
ncbi:hypothetical protein K1T71_010579 [Dendrolimus kikuchii]|uniref:Uncharacterized protein n=1 Tax=Dendrolimus kikuchii TaxID=765133 RepID=A0ACC1CPC2_9NEOP|nr:hypothetical protein K1T71_010579 [Dendrolimus kikuchii]